MDGARKYGPYNWREEGVSAVTYVSAAMRHLRDWLDGEEEAPDSGVHHLGHAVACLAIILDSIEVGNLVDDRPLPAPTGAIFERMKVAKATNVRWDGAAASGEGSYEQRLRQAIALAPGNHLFRDLLDQHEARKADEGSEEQEYEILEEPAE
jgi:hypothetical protein